MTPENLEARMKRLAPRVPTPTAPDTGRVTGTLPDDVVAGQVERLTLFCLVTLGLWIYALAMDVILPPQALGTEAPAGALYVHAFAIATAVAVWGYVRYAHQAPAVKADAGLWLMLLNAGCIAVLETAFSEIHVAPWHVSWVAIAILISAMIMPSTPWKMLAAGLAAATMGPIGVWVAHLRGADVPSVGATFVMYASTYLCAVVAPLPSRMFQGLGRQLREARELGSYQLVELLGQGGMGEVWRARHRWLAREAAVKLVRPAALGTSSIADARVLLRRFEREAQATASLSSPHSIRLFDFGATNEGHFYYAMELLVGRDLETFVQEFGPLPEERVGYLLRQICHSLAEAHERGLVHRDIKPANIYLCRLGLDYDFIKVLDFGLVKFGSRDASLAPTQTFNTSAHVTMGTPAYMAPEIILGRSDVDRRADVYAIGCVAYFLLTGQRVFEGGNAMQALVDHVHSAPLPPSERSRLPIAPEMDALVLACLAKNPDRRPQDAAALARIVRGCPACGGWSNQQAQEWWEGHLPSLAGPLTFSEAQRAVVDPQADASAPSSS